MSLHDTIKELKEQIIEEEKKESETAEAKTPEPEPAPAPEPTPEESPAPAPAPEPSLAPAPAPGAREEKPDDAAFQRLRREKAAAEKRATELEEKLAAKNKPAEEEPETEAAAADPEIEAIKHDRRLAQAEREFVTLEAKFAAGTPDYHDVSAEYAVALAQSIKIQNPRMSNADVAEETKKALLVKASNYVNKGFDPIEELYNEAKELGFTGKSRKKAEEKPKEEKKEDIKPDMAKLAQNRKRSAGMAGATGEQKTEMSRSYIEQNGLPTNSEWARLSKDEKRRLMYG